MLTGEISKHLSPLVVDEQRLYQLACHFSETYRHLALTSKNQFLSTPVTEFPTGQERGRFLAIDLGGSNLRVGLVELYGAGRSENERTTLRPCHEFSAEAEGSPFRMAFERSWPIGDHLKMDKAEDLFAWIGDCIAKVVAETITFSLHHNATVSRELALGITFSFPMMYAYSLIFPIVLPYPIGFSIVNSNSISNLYLKN